MNRSRVVILAALAAVSLAAPARAQDAGKLKEAGQHFQRGVSLYNEADYNGALVEFKRAYAIAPNVNVLYNIGQSQYELQRYAQALDTFRRYLAEGGTTHKAEVEEAIGVLANRVGSVNLTTNVAGADVSVDDESVAKTPLAKPLAVGVGRRKITVTAPGREPQTKYVEVAAGETVDAAFPFEQAATAAPPLEPEKPAEHHSHTLATVGWLTTGVLTSAAVVTGLLALDFSNKLATARNTFPGDKADISSKASTTTAFAVTTDVLGGLAIIAAGLSIYWTVKPPTTRSSTELKAAVGPGSIFLAGTF